MNKDPRFEELRELGWRRELTEAERAQLQTWLTGDPEARQEWRKEAQLNRALRSLGDVPVASNFTARVLEAVRREDAERARPGSGVRWLWSGPWRWLPRVAFTTLVITSGLLSYRYVNAVHREELARSVAAVSEAAQVPAPELLEDYDAITALNATPPADEQLLLALTK